MAGAASLYAHALRAPSPASGPAAGRRDGAAGLALAWTPRPRFPSLWVARRVAVRAAAVAGAGNPEEEWGKGPEPAANHGGAATTTTSEVAELKARLKEALYGTERALRAPSGTRAEVAGLITQLEARHRAVAPAEALAFLDGKWILVFALNYMDRSWKRHAEAWYTSFSELLPLLGYGRLPELVKVEEIAQAVDSKNFSVQNCIKFSGPLATTSVSTNAKFEVRSPKRVQIKFDKGIVSTPHLTDSIVLPRKFELLEQNIDLRLLEGIFSSIENAASSVATTVFGQPPLKISMWTNNAESWLLTTYVDKDLRISRGDRGSIFVLFKEGSTLLN